MKKNPPLTIAGFDPSSGAGFTRDLAVFQELDLEGISVCTAITYQNENTFSGLDWLSENEILAQIKILAAAYKLEFVKIGLIENLTILEKVIDLLFEINKDIKIIWDPILSASAGFVFHNNITIEQFSFVEKLFLITPNIAEAKKLGIIEANGFIKKTSCNILIKSYKETEFEIIDLLCLANTRKEIGIQKIPNGSIHGSGCRLSSAILINLAKNHSLETACELAQIYLSKKIKENL